VAWVDKASMACAWPMRGTPSMARQVIRVSRSNAVPTTMTLPYASMTTFSAWVFAAWPKVS
jgi:hypothetical protein